MRTSSAVRAVHRGRLDEEDVAARAGHGKTCGDTGDRRPVRRLLEELLAAERVPHDLHVDLDGRLDLARGDARRGLAQDGAELALELPDARLACVLGDDQLDRVVRDRDLVLAQPVPLDLARPEVAARDRSLLVDRVAVEADDLHPVEQRAGDRVGDVRGRDEEDLGEIELDVEVVVAE